MLTFELTPDHEQVFLHGDVDGLRSLITKLERLLARTKDGDFEHEHLMTPAWAGQELTSERVDERATLIHHVKVYCWRTSPGTRASES